MLRIRAVQEMLVGDVAGVRVPERDEGTPAERAADLAYEMERARKKALAMAVLAWMAIAALLATHGRSAGFLSLEGTDAAFTVGILLLAVFSGFRLGQWYHYRAVERVLEELSEREG